MQQAQATKSIDKRIERFMADQKIGVGEMANLLGMTTNSLRWKRTGKQDWKWSEVLRMSDLMGMSVDELIHWKEADGEGTHA